MKSMVSILAKPVISNPVLIEGLPGIGFVANISSLHLISELSATKIAEIRSPAFQDLSVSAREGSFRAPINELYHAKCNGKDLLILYGNTQALNTHGQYELCETILDLVAGYECRFIITIGGLRRAVTPGVMEVYCTATNQNVLQSILRYGVKVADGRVIGVAGLLLGLAKLRGMEGLCILVETPGLYPDPVAAEKALSVLARFLNVKLDLTRLQEAARKVEKELQQVKPPVPSRGYPGLV
jgi:hypothetical protein